MMELELAKSLASFGGVGILALVMWLSSKAATAERQAITDRFLQYQEKNADGQRALIREVLQSIHANTEAIHANTGAIEKFSQLNTTEHNAMLAAVTALTRHVEQIGRVAA